MSISWATTILEKIDNGEKVSDDELEKAHQILAEQFVKQTSLPKYAKNQTELAELFEVDRKTIQRWRKDPDFPKAAANGRWDVRATQKWIQEHTEDSTSPDLHDLKCRQLQLMCEKLEFELKTKRGDYTPNEDVVKWVGEMVTEAKTILLTIPPKLAPIISGLTPVEAEARLKESIDEALARLHMG